ncbi:hypothetical protein [Mucilaginibacter sp.]|uniref:hypothetical protein n=1 Tax=Mucilaginibacter sp. TaxID=1882438 RepID=UPI0028462F63|nr:hypothetical protein [Mucilaginibacter sp.]MDR3697867.1 hypothetical protein [Mucilaginibacter sp.]
MKIFKATLAILFLMIAFISCSKDNKSPAPVTVTPLVKETVVTYPNYRVVFDNTYDDEKRLISAGINSGLITYNAGGFEIVSTYADGSKSITDVSLENGRIGTVLNYAAANDRYNSTFSYDGKGRLVNILQTRTYNGQVIYHLAFTYSWDDNDDLVNSNLITDSGSDNVSYSGFSAENVNTLGGKNFGFDYFGTTDYPSDYVPNNNGGSGFIFPSVYAGKLLPSVIKMSGKTYNVTYHKNTLGYIDKIEQVNATDATDMTITDISYE